MPSNTKKNNAWAERTFDAWVEEQNKLMMLGDLIPTNSLQCHDTSVMSMYMYSNHFVLEARTQNGKKYRSSALRILLSGLNKIPKESKGPFAFLRLTQ